MGLSSMQTIKHLQGTQPKSPTLHSLLPSVPPFLPGTLSSACFPSSLRLPASSSDLSLLQLVLASLRFLTFLSFAETLALGLSGFNIFPTVSSVASEVLAARDANNRTRRLHVFIYLFLLFLILEYGLSIQEGNSKG